MNLDRVMSLYTKALTEQINQTSYLLHYLNTPAALHERAMRVEADVTRKRSMGMSPRRIHRKPALCPVEQTPRLWHRHECDCP